MSHKVLLADDSLTIQKVIKITLASQPYEITDASSEEELFKKLPSVQPKIVFLDFNLSDKYTGYELTEKIKSIVPSAKVLLLLGTFDMVDDAAMIKSGASDKIVKPFDSNKFIAICKQMIDSFNEDEADVNAIKKVAPTAPETNDDDQWVVNHSVEQKLTVSKTESHNQTNSSFNLLTKEISDWGMSIPGVISGESSNPSIDLPPIISEKVDPIKVQKFPKNDDLDYPTIEEMTKPIDLTHKKSSISKLISVESFNDDKLELETVKDSYKREESNVLSIQDQIRDEVEDNLWQVDEFEDLKNEVSSKIDEVKGSFQPPLNAFDESLFKPLDDNDRPVAYEEKNKKQTVSVASFDSESMRQEIEVMVKKYVQEYMDQMFQKNVEKISWEVIPDLAENLIRQELVKISSKILSDQH